MTAKTSSGVPAGDKENPTPSSEASVPTPRIFLAAGEASGDLYGAQIIAELRARIPAATFIGLGGTEMAAAGQTRIVRAEDVAHLGITEVIRHMPYIFTQYRKLVAVLKGNKGVTGTDPSSAENNRRPDIAVLIDFPDVNFRLAKHCKRLEIPVVWFVSPQLWAWKRRRLRWVQQRVSKMLVIFPFEEPFYRHRGVDAEFVGHPLATEPLTADSSHSSQLTVEQQESAAATREAYAKQATEISQDQWYYGGDPRAGRPVQIAKETRLGQIRYELDPAKPWIALLPGSRISEIRNNLRRMIDAAYEIPGEYEFIVPMAPTITERQLAAIQYNTGDLYLGKDNAPKITFVRDARGALHHSRAAIVASGTATVQALTIGNPFVVVYRVSRLTFALAKRLVRYPPEITDPFGSEAALKDADGNLPIAMVNLIAGRRIVTELLNRRFTARNVAAALRPLLGDTPERARMVADLAEARAKLLPLPEPSSANSQPAQPATPIQRVCDITENLLLESSGK